MGICFRKSIRILPGVRINLGTRGASLSVGRRGATVTVNQDGVYANTGLPGSGLSYRQQVLDWEDLAQPQAQPPQSIAPTPSQPRTASDANLRSGPGTNYDIAGSAPAGQPLTVVGRSSDGDWLRLPGDLWIAAALVADAPADLPIAQAPPPPTAPPPTPTRFVAPIEQRAAPTVSPRSGCDPSYPTVCIPYPSADLDCPQVPYRNFAVTGSDPHRFDRDGVGCES